MGNTVSDAIIGKEATTMDVFMAQKIINQRKVSLEAGQARYRLYFITCASLYGQWQSSVDTILLATDIIVNDVEVNCGDCIVTE